MKKMPSQVISPWPGDVYGVMACNEFSFLVIRYPPFMGTSVIWFNSETLLSWGDWSGTHLAPALVFAGFAFSQAKLPVLESG